METNEIELEELLSKAEDLEQLNNFCGALNIYDRLLDAYPDNPKIWAFRGYCNYRQKEFSVALADFTRALEIRGDVATTLFLRAQVYERLGKPDNALDDFERSASLSPEADVFMNIGLIQKYLGNEAQCRDALIEALALDPDNETIQNLLSGLTVTPHNDTTDI